MSCANRVGRRGRLAPILVAMVMTMAARPVSASVTRVLGLAGGGDYLTDDANVRRWYADLTRWDRQASFEPGVCDLHAGGNVCADRTTGRGAGLLLPLDTAGRFGSVGFFLDNDLPEHEPGGGIGVAYGRGFGALAATLSFVGTSFAEWHGGSAELYQWRSNYFHELGLGLRWSVSDSVTADFAGEIVNTQFSVTDVQLGQDFVSPSTWQSFGLRARLRLPATDLVTIVPLLDYWRDLRATYAAILPAAARRDAWQTRAGFGVRYAPAADRLFLFSGEYRRGTEDYTALGGYLLRYDRSARDYFSLHCRFAVEWQARPWLRARVGAEYRRVDDGFDRKRGHEWDDYWDRVRGGSVRAEVPVSAGCTLASGSLAVDLAVTAGAPSMPRFLRGETAFEDEARLLAATLRCAF